MTKRKGEKAQQPRLLETHGCQGGATAGYQRAGWHVTAVDINRKVMGLGIKPPLYHCVDHAGKAPCPNCVPFGALSSTPADQNGDDHA